jgi:hypothetical protein
MWERRMVAVSWTQGPLAGAARIGFGTREAPPPSAAATHGRQARTHAAAARAISRLIRSPIPPRDPIDYSPSPIWM